jgi:VCBS repeat-containing protein
LKSVKYLILLSTVIILFSCKDSNNSPQSKAPESFKSNLPAQENLRKGVFNKLVVPSYEKRTPIQAFEDPWTQNISKDFVVTDPPKPKIKTKRSKIPYNFNFQTSSKEINKIKPNQVKSLSTDFDTINFDGDASNAGFYHIPADPHGAAGLNHVINVVNTSIEIYQKDGTLVSSESLASFFSALSPATGTFDPKVIYDQFEDRYLVVTLEKVQGATAAQDKSVIFLAVSANSNPTGTWYFTEIDVLESITSVNHWLDYPGFAVDEEAVYITGNMFSFAGSFGDSRLVIIDKGVTGGFYAGSSTSPNIVDSSPVGFAGTMQPAHVYGAPSDSNLGTYLIMYSGISNGVTESFQVMQVNTPLGTPSFTRTLVPFGNEDDTSGSLPNSPQSGTSNLISSNDRRTLNAVLRNNSLWVTSTVVPNTGDPDAGEATALWAEIDVSTPATLTLNDLGLIGGEDIATNTYTIFPAIAVNDDGGVAVAFSASASSLFPGSYMAVRSPNDPAGSMRSSVTIRAGVDHYTRTFGGPRNRWGDYIAMALDPNGECFWAYNKYAMSRGTTFSGEDGRWATAFGNFCNSSPVAVNDSATVDQGQTVTVLNSGQTSLMFNDTDADSFDTQSLNVTPASAPSHGNVTINSAGTFSYTHDNSNNLTDSFDYTICDDGSPSKCDTGTVNIVINSSAGNTTVTTCFNGSPPADDIPDNDSNGLTRSINLASSATLVDLNVSLNVSHTWVGDLIVSLENVSTGTTVVLMDRPGVPSSANGCAEDNINTIFDDDSVNTVESECSASTPAIGFLTDSNPEGALSDFIGENQVGDWNLTISDNVNVDTGTLNQWCLISTTSTIVSTAVNDTGSLQEDAVTPLQPRVRDNDTIIAGALVISVTQPSNGTSAVIGGGTDVSYVPNADYCNDGSPTDDFTYTLNGGSSATVAVTVTCVDDDATAVNDSATVDEDSDSGDAANTINVSDNDTDPDGGDKDVRSIVSQPDNGLVTFTSSTVTYTPNANYCNNGSPTDDFIYDITGGSSATVSITVTCIDDNPVAVNDVATVSEDSSDNSITVLTNDTDIDSGPKNITAVSDPTNGTTSFTSAMVNYTPDPNYCNDGSPTDNFTYTINGGTTATVAVSVTCVDDFPVAVNDFETVIEDSINNSFNVISNDTDIDGGAKEVRDITQPSNGSAVFTSTNVSYSPNSDYCNDGLTTDDFTYTLSGGSIGTVSMTVTCTDDLAVADDDAPAAILEDSGANVINVLNNDSDADGDLFVVISTTNGANGSVAITNAGANLSYTPNLNYCGVDTFTYTITGGDSATVSMLITCVNDPAVATDDNPSAINEDSGANQIDVLSNDTDVESDSFIVIDKTDGSNGLVAITNAGDDVSYTPNLNFCGLDSFTYTITGDDTATVNVDVNCIDDPAVAVDDSPAAIEEDSGANNIDVLANDSDVEMNSFVVIAKTNGANGDVAITNAGADLSYTPNLNFCGDDSFSYTITGNDTATVSVQVTCIDDPAVAEDDTPPAVAQDSSSNIIDVLFNDTDVDGGVLNVTAVSSASHGAVVNGVTNVSYTPTAGYCGNDSFNYTITGGDTAMVFLVVDCANNDLAVANDDFPNAIDEDSGANLIDVLANDSDTEMDPFFVINKTNGANGIVTITNAGNDLSYTPNTNFCGNDSFTYTITGNDVANVSIVVTCIDDPSVANDDNPTAFDEDSGANIIDVLSNDTDIENNDFFVIATTNGANGNVIITNAGNDLSYTPNPNFCGNDSFTYTITGSDTATVNVIVNCINDPAVAVDDFPASINENSGATQINVLGNDSDVEDDPFSVINKTNGAKGSVTITNAGLDVSYLPNTDTCGNDSFTYTITGNDSATVFISIICDNQPADAVDDFPAAIDEDSGANNIDVLANDSDFESDAFVIEAKTNGSNGTVMITNAGLDLSYTPNNNFCGNDSFTYTITGGDSASVSIDVNCIDDLPIAIADNITIDEDANTQFIDVLMNDTDIDGGAKQVIGVGLAAHGVVSFDATGVFYTPDPDYCNEGDSTDDFTYTITGGASAAIDISINCVNDQPSFESDSDVFTSLDELSALPSQTVVCNLDMGPDNEDSSQSLADVVVSIQSDPDNILNAVDILNDGSLSPDYSGNQGVAVIEVFIQDDGGVAHAGNDSSSTEIIRLHVQDYIFKSAFEAETCPQ